jgi:hypothetical protein
VTDDYEELTVEDFDDVPTELDAPVKLPETYWLTRDRQHGVLSDKVDVWAVKPDRVRFADGDVQWFAPEELIDYVTTWLAEWTLAECPTTPDDDRMCVRIGAEPVILNLA